MTTDESTNQEKWDYRLPVAGAVVAFLLAWLWGFDREISFGAFLGCSLFAVGGFFLPGFVAALMGKSGRS